MSNLLQVYKNKDDNETNITVRKTYLLGVDELYIEPGYNVRDIKQEQVEALRDAFIAGEYVPPVAVQVTDKGIKVIDGHHRWHSAKLAQAEGHDIRLECKDFVGSEADRIAFMVTSSQGRALEEQSIHDFNDLLDMLNAETRMNGGNHTRSNTEDALIATRGTGLPRASASVKQVVYSCLGEHSAKPWEVRNRLEQLYGDVSRIELFARTAADGWDCWGNQCDSSVQLIAGRVA